MANSLADKVKEFEGIELVVFAQRVSGPDAKISQYRALINFFGISQQLEQGVLDFLIKGQTVGVYLNSAPHAVFTDFEPDLRQYDSFEVTYKTYRLPDDGFIIVRVEGYKLIYDPTPYQQTPVATKKSTRK